MEFFIVRLALDVMHMNPFNGWFRELCWLFYPGNLRRFCSLGGSERERDSGRIQSRLRGLRRRGRRRFPRWQCLSTWENELFFIIGLVVIQGWGLTGKITQDVLYIFNPDRRVISRSNVIIGGTWGATGRPNPAQDRQNKVRLGSKQ